MERMVLVGEMYRHFRGGSYLVLAIAKHTETGEAMVVYQGVGDNAETYVRPYDMFVGEVDKGKYPEADQKYRFEKVEDEESRLEAFLEAKSFRDKIEIFKQMKDKMDERLVNNIAVVLDVTLEEGTMEAKYEALLQSMKARARFETNR